MSSQVVAERDRTPPVRAIAPLALAILSALAFTACGAQEGGQGSGQGSESGTRVVASNSIVADLVENVGGEEVEVTTLVGPNADVHNFDPSPAASRDLAEADVVFENGLELEPWMDDLYASSGTEADRVALGEAEGIEPLTAEEHGHDHGGGEGAHEEHEGEHTGGAHSEEEHHEEGTEGHKGGENDEETHGEAEGGHGHDHGEYDPHVWHDPQNAVAMVSEIEAALSEVDPDNADTYDRNAGAYTSELEELDAEVEEMVAGIPEENRKLVTAHDTFGYYADRYGFEIVGTSLESFSTEASDPSAGETAELADEIESEGVPAIFPENVSNEAVMERISSEADAELAPPLYTDALGEPDGEAGTYVEMLRYNSRTISEALG